MVYRSASGNASLKYSRILSAPPWRRSCREQWQSSIFSDQFLTLAPNAANHSSKPGESLAEEGLNREQQEQNREPGPSLLRARIYCSLPKKFNANRHSMNVAK